MNASNSYSYRILKSIKDRGILRTAKLVYAERFFDWRFGTDTAGIIPLDKLEVVSEHKADGERYEGWNPLLFRELMAQLPISDLHRHTFLDFGCGKGLVMMLAAQHGFQKIIGVEFSKRLCEVCESNLQRFRRSARRDCDFHLINGDAAEYPVPTEVTVFCFFNPFGAITLGKVLKNIQASLAESPRRIWIAYGNAVHHDTVLAAGFRVVFRQTVNSLRIYPNGSAIYTNDAVASC